MIFTSISSLIVGIVGATTTGAGCTVGIVERGLEDLRTGELRIPAGEARLAGDDLVRPGDARLAGDDLVRPGDARRAGDDLGRPGDDLGRPCDDLGRPGDNLGRPGEAVFVDNEDSVLAVDAVLIAALLLPPTLVPAVVATGIDVLEEDLVSGISFLLRPRVKRRGLSISYYCFNLSLNFYFSFFSEIHNK